LKKSIKRIVYSILGTLDFTRSLNQESNLIVLAYHTVTDRKKFEAQLHFLKNNYNIINVGELEEHLFKGNKLLPNSLLISFDDGDISVLESGLPLLKKHKLPSVMFVITSLIDSDNTFWCRWVEKAFQNQGKSYAEARSKVNHLKKISNKNRMVYLNSLDPVNSRQLTKEDLGTMQKGMMFIGNHTHTHPMVDMCTREEIESELNKSRSCFEEWELPGYPIFAYPNGNWDEQSENLLKKNGIKIAFLFDHKINAKIINPFRISRIRVNSDTEINEFKVKVSGLHSKLMKLKEKIS